MQQSNHQFFFFLKICFIFNYMYICTHMCTCVQVPEVRGGGGRPVWNDENRTPLWEQYSLLIAELSLCQAQTHHF